MLNRLDELECLMNIVSTHLDSEAPNTTLRESNKNHAYISQVKTDAAITMHKNLPEIYSYQAEFHKLCNNIDNLEAFVQRANDNVTKVEQQVVQAEGELGINSTGIRGLFRPLLGIVKKRTDPVSPIDAVVSAADKMFEPVEIFKSSDYFGNSDGGEK